MSITYPLIPPGYPGAASMRLTMQNLVAVSQSQFTGAQQVQQWPGEWWEAEWSLPSMWDSQAAAWRAFFAGLRGQAGTFLMCPNANYAPQGFAGQVPNWLIWSEDFTQSVWLKYASSGVTTPNIYPSGDNTTSPSGSGAQLLYFPGVTSGQVANISQFTQPCASGTSVPVTASIWLKAQTTPTTMTLYFQDAAEMGFVGTTINVTTTWTRFSVSGTLPQTASRGLVFVIAAASPAAVNVYAWGAQLERNPSVGPYLGAMSPQVNGTAIGSQSMSIRYAWACQDQIIWKAGDLFQAGSHLYSVLSDATCDGSGNTTVNIFPAARPDAVDGATVTWIDPAGLWRLSENPRNWGISPGQIYDFSGIKCREAI